MAKDEAKELEVLKGQPTAEVAALTTDENGFTVVLANGRVFRSTSGKNWLEDPPVPGTMADYILKRDTADPLAVAYRQTLGALQGAALNLVDSVERPGLGLNPAHQEARLIDAAREFAHAVRAKREADEAEG